MSDRPEGIAEPSDGERGSSNMMWLFGQLLVIPFAGFLYSVELLVKTMREMQESTMQGMQVMVGSGVRFADAAKRSNDAINPRRTYASAAQMEAMPQAEKILARSHDYTVERNLRDDLLKLVRYRVLFVKRGYEHAFPERESLVWDNLEDSVFAGWKIAEFIQSLAKRHTGIPYCWGNSYPPKEEDKTKLREDNVLLGLPKQDKKYLRVFYEVLERFPREKFRYEERQIQVLEEIRDIMADPSPSSYAEGSNAKDL